MKKILLKKNVKKNYVYSNLGTFFIICFLGKTHIKKNSGRTTKVRLTKKANKKKVFIIRFFTSQDKVELIKKLNSVGQEGSPGAEGQGGSPGADSLKNSLSELTEELQISREQIWLLEETSLLGKSLKVESEKKNQQLPTLMYFEEKKNNSGFCFIVK